MADVVSKASPQAGVLRSVDTPQYPSTDWFVNPTLPTTPAKYWKNDGGVLAEMTAQEKATVDATLQQVEDTREKAVYHVETSNEVSGTTSDAWQQKVELVTVNLSPGDYALTYSWMVVSTSVSTRMEVRLEHVNVSEVVLPYKGKDEMGIGSGYLFLLNNLAGVHTFRVSWRKSGGSGSAKILNAFLALRKVK